MDLNIMIQIGKRLRRHRENMNLTREEFAEKANISPQFLAEIENGKKGMSVDTLYKICKNLSISADYILFGLLSNNALSDSAKNVIGNLPEPLLSYTEDIIQIVNNIVAESKGKY
ncbi:MAG: helix-turn-helix transcriptional regulator [Tissierellia bacterium]|nr:helix-turn-helix transcriptional regulator [Tissierellia bacterium]